MSLESDTKLEAEIEQIRSLPIDEIRARWRQTFKSRPPAALSKDMLGRMIAYHIQEKVLGGLTRATRRALDDIGRGKPAVETAQRRLKPGTVMVREYQGERHSVAVASDGFVWREETYTSLSIIARLITGTNWSGPKFFGLRLSGSKPKKAVTALRNPPRRSKRRTR